MFNKTFKKSLIILVACLMFALVVFAACDNTDEFKSGITDGISGQTVQGNGGIAVQYGDYIYYVNGYQSDATADNSYTNTIRSGAIVRVKTSQIDNIVSLNNEDLSSSEKAERINAAVKENVQLVVPVYYYSANTTGTALTGIYIFGDRLYITTPNQALTDGGQKLTNQLVLESYKLDGSDRKQHFVFVGSTWSTSTASLSIMLTEVGGQVWATYVLDSDLHSVNVGEGKDTVIAEDITNAKFDKANNVVFYMDEDGQICQFNAGATEGKVLVEKVDTDESKLTYTISAISDGYVYYTQADSVNSTLDGLVVYYAHFDGTNVTKGVVLNAIPDVSYLGWGSKVVYVETETHGGTTAKTYTVWAAYVEDGETMKDKLFTSRDSITLVKVENGLLYYTVDSVTYTVELGTTNDAIFYAKSLGTSATGWATPDVVGKYTFSLGTGTVSVVVYDADTAKNSSSTDITLYPEIEEE